jgi:hypothetical protein
LESTSPRQCAPTMTRHEGEITRSDLEREWPHHVALAAEKDGAMVRRIANALSVAPLTYTLRRSDKYYVVFCFARAEHAEAFRETFGGERLPTGSQR